MNCVACSKCARDTFCCCCSLLLYLNVSRAHATDMNRHARRKRVIERENNQQQRPTVDYSANTADLCQSQPHTHTHSPNGCESEQSLKLLSAHCCDSKLITLQYRCFTVADAAIIQSGPWCERNNRKHRQQWGRPHGHIFIWTEYCTTNFQLKQILSFFV